MTNFKTIQQIEFTLKIKAVVGFKILGKTIQQHKLLPHNQTLYGFDKAVV